MAGLMSHAPPASENDALADPIDSPAAPFSDRTSKRGGTTIIDKTSSERFNVPSKFIQSYSRYHIACDVE